MPSLTSMRINERDMPVPRRRGGRVQPLGRALLGLLAPSAG